MLADREPLGGGDAVGAERGVDDPHAAVAGPVEGGGDVGAPARAVGAEDAQRDHAGLGSDADRAEAVLGRGDRAGHVRAVAVEVLREAVVADPVVAGEQPCRQVRMGEVDAGVDDRDGGAGAARDRPRLRRVDVGVERAAAPPDALAAVVERPLELGQRVGGGGATAVGLGPDHVGIGAQLGDGPRPVAVVRDDDLDAGDPERALERDVRVRPHVRPLGGAQARAAA